MLLRSGGKVRRIGIGVATLSVFASGVGVSFGTAKPATAATICKVAARPSKAALSSSVGVSAKQIRVGNISIVSGPVPGLFQGAPYGVSAYFAYINSKGGVHGRKLVLDSYDDGFSGTQNQSQTSAVVGRDLAMVGSFSLFDGYGCPVLAKNPAVPDVSVSLDPATNALPNAYSPQPLVPGAATAGYAYMKKLYPKAVGHVANLVSNTDSALAQWAGQKSTMERLGYRFDYVRNVSPVETNFTTDVINMRNKGVQMVLLTDGDWQIFSALVKAMGQQHWRPKVMFSAGPVYDQHFIKAAGSGANGIWLAQGASLYLGQDAKRIPAVATFDTWMRKTHPGFSPDLFTLYGWSSAALFVQALQAAGNTPTRGKVLAALSRINKFSASGLLAPSNPAKKIPANCVVFAQIKNGNFVRSGPTSKSNLDCSQPYVTQRGTKLWVRP